jgi:hypothetical protein
MAYELPREKLMERIEFLIQENRDLRLVSISRKLRIAILEGAMRATIEMLRAPIGKRGMAKITKTGQAHRDAGHIVERRENQFLWQNRHFSGLVCVTCGLLFDDPDDSFVGHIIGNAAPGSPESA